jgi:hypothetical protein
MFLNELHVRFAQLYLVMSISSLIVLYILLFFFDFGRKVKKVEEGDSAPEKKTRSFPNLLSVGKGWLRPGSVPNVGGIS